MSNIFPLYDVDPRRYDDLYAQLYDVEKNRNLVHSLTDNLRSYVVSFAPFGLYYRLIESTNP